MSQILSKILSLSKRAEWMILAAILLVGAVLRLLYLGEISVRPDFTHPGIDAAYHIHWARGLATGRWEAWPGRADPQIYRYPYYRPPGYAFFLAGVYRLFGPGARSPRLIQMAMGLASAALAYFLGRKWMGSAAGLIFAFLQATYWIFIFYEGELLDPAPTVFLSLSFVGLTASAAFGFKFWKVLAAGLALGFLVLVRPNALLLLPPAGLWLVWELRRRGERRRAWPAGGVLALAAAAAIFPVTLRNYLVGGEWVPIATNQGISLLVANNPDSDGTTHTIPGIGEIGTPFDYPRIVHQLSERLGRPLTPGQASDHLSREAWRFIRANPGRFLWLTGRKALLFWGPYEVRNVKEVHYGRLNSRVLRLIPLNFSLVLALGLAGGAWWWRDRRRGEAGEEWSAVGVLAALAALGYFISMLPFAAAARYRVPAIPFLIWFASWGIKRWADLARSGSWKRAAVAVLATAAVWFLVSRNWAGYRPSPEKWHYEMALAYFGNGKLEPAMEGFREALRHRPDFYQARHNLGNIHALKNDYPSALDQLRIAAALAPEAAEVRNSLGDIFYKMGRVEEAGREFREAIRLRPGLAQAWNNLGSVFAVEGDYRQAMASYRRALELQPGEVSFQLNLARSLVYQEEREEAGVLLRAIIESDPDNHAAREELEKLESL